MEEKKACRVAHTFEPVFDSHSRVLILGTMPSPESRKQGFYYSHPRNRFWKVMSSLLKIQEPATVEERKNIALNYHFALWDVLAECEIKGASDLSIRRPVPNKISVVLEHAPIKCIFTTGKKAAELYTRYCLDETGIEAVSLPSTSPANCRVTFEQLREEYLKILPYLGITGRIPG